MKDVKTIFLKEFRGYFNSPVAYIVIIAWLILSSWFFTSGLFLVNQADIGSFFDLAPLFFLFIIPATCMRLLAEEEKLGTVELLGTMPLQDWTIITGKYLAAFAVVGIGILCTLVYPISVALLGKLDWGVVVSSYIGLLLLDAGFCAIGIFTSSVTKSQVIALILNIVICFVFYILGKVLGVMSAGIVTILQYMSIDYHLESMGRGVIDSRSVIYFFSMIAFFLCFTFYFYRKAKHRVLSGLSVTILLAIIIIVNILSYNIFGRLDLSSGKVYSLSRSSTKIIRSLEDPVIIRAYITGKLMPPYNTWGKYTKDLLSEYRIKSRGKVKFELIDPTDQDKQKDQEKKMEAQRAGIEPLSFQDRKAGEFAVKEGFMGLVFIYGDKKEVIPVIQDITSLEYDITGRIKKLTEKSEKTIGFTKGHNEMELDKRLQEELQKRYLIQDVNLDSTDIPSNLSTLIFLGPKGEYNDTVAQKVKNFLESGKSCGFLLDRMNINTQYYFAFPVKTGLDKVLSNYNVTLKDGLVLDYQNQIIGISMQRGEFRMQNLIPYPFFPKATDLNRSSPIVRDFDAFVMPFSGAIEGGTPLIKSSKRSWIKQDIKSINPMEQQIPLPAEEKGPFNLAVTNEKPRFIVTGTSKFIDPAFNMSAADAAFLFNIIDWLAADEDLIAIRSKGISERPLKETTEVTKGVIKWTDTLLPSLILIIIGFVRIRRRNKRIYEI